MAKKEYSVMSIFIEVNLRHMTDSKPLEPQIKKKF